MQSSPYGGTAPEPTPPWPPASPLYPAVRRQPMNWRFGAGIASVAVAIAFALLALVTPWWSAGTRSSDTGTPVGTPADYYLRSLCGRSGGVYVCLPYSSYAWQISNAFAWTLVLEALGVFFGIASLASLIAGSRWRMAGYALLGMGALGCLLLVLAPVYLLLALPAAFAASGNPIPGFFGRIDVGAPTYIAFGAGLGWYLSLLACLLLLVGTRLGSGGVSLTRRGRRARRRAPFPGPPAVPAPFPGTEAPAAPPMAPPPESAGPERDANPPPQEEPGSQPP